MTNPEHSYSDIKQLIDKFKNLSGSQRKHMNEDATRLGFILPMFSALGWNITDMNEVSPEEKVSRGWVDFSLRIGGIPRLFLETKRASEDLNDPRWVKQTVDYAWMKSVTWALLSDFEGLRVFNSEWKETDPFKSQFIEFDLSTYLSDFERLWWLSREETASSRLTQEAEKWGKKTKRQPVSQHLFDDLRKWRGELYKSLRGYNPLWSPEQIDGAVLRLLNRLIFIRTAEDRDVEPNQLRSLIRELTDKRRMDRVFDELRKLFREFDLVYNSQLFAPHIIDQLYCDRPPIEDLINGLYEKDYVSYNFNAIDADVLGTAYEQYLGHIIADAEAQAHVEEKRAKRKSQGIFYTPSFVVKYIVQQTLGKHLEENGYNPSKPVRVLDMACGSGSFLIEAFDTLDQFVARQRGQHKGEKEDVLDYARRIEILTQCIYGVDKDSQAVEVARLNLLLRALSQREKLPLLENIVNGDSLTGDVWEKQFSEVMQAGGFDVIIGNPPYVRQETLGVAFKEFAQARFETYAGTADLYIYFIEQAHKLLKPGGYFGMIVSNKWMRSNYGKGLREFLRRESKLVEIIDFGELPVFGDVLAYPVILITRKARDVRQNPLYAPIKRLDFTSLQEEIDSVGTTLVESSLSGVSWTISENREQAIITKLCEAGTSLHDYVDGGIFYGMKTGFNEAFIIDRQIRNQLIASDSKSAEVIVPFLLGRDVHEYFIDYKGIFLIFTRRGIRINDYPAVYKYLENFKDRLMPRPKEWHGDIWSGRKPGSYEWYEVQDTVEYYTEFRKNKIILPSIVRNATFAYDLDGYYSNDKTSIIPTDDLYLLGVLNSKVSDFILRRTSSTKQGGYFEQKPMYISQLPIHRIDFDNPIEKSAHDEIVEAVEEMLDLQKNRAEAERNFDERRFTLQKRIEQVDSEIDLRVYKLYGLTEDEIRVIDGIKDR